MSNSKIIQTKRGKLNPDHMFVKPKFTRDPAKQNLERCVFNNDSIVPPGTYDIEYVNAIGSQEFEEARLKKLKNYQYNAFKQYENNKHWIEKARTNYKSKTKGNVGNESLEQFMEANGFDIKEEISYFD